MSTEEIINKTYSRLVDLMGVIDGYEEFVIICKKTFEKYPDRIEILKENLIRKANSSKIKSASLLEDEKTKRLGRIMIVQSEEIINWLDSYNNKSKLEKNQIKKNIDLEMNSIWEIMHVKVVELAKERFEGEFFADAILNCLRELNGILKEFYKNKTGKELDGATLITSVFSPKNPLIKLDDLSTENGQNIQLGYMKIFEGMMIGIRNAKSHVNMYPDKKITIHFLFFSSFMFMKLEEHGLLNK